MGDPVQQARNMLETVKNEICVLDAMMQLYEGVREIVLANDAINKKNDVFWLMTVTYFDSALMRLRRLADTNRRTTSLVTLIEHIRGNVQSFTREWHKSMYADAQDFVRELEKGWWKQRADKTGAYLCQDKLLCMAAKVIDKVKKCKAWVDSTIAHFDRRRPSAPTVDEFKKAFVCVREIASDLCVLLTAKSDDLRVDIAVDWEEVLRVPWIAAIPGA